MDGHQTDWDDYLPFVTMANGPLGHETTDSRQIYLMLGIGIQPTRYNASDAKQCKEQTTKPFGLGIKGKRWKQFKDL